MCGLTGFFVGCRLADACGGRNMCKPFKQTYRSSFDRWDDRASVRASRRPVLGSGDLFPNDMIPILSHPEIARLPEKTTEALRADHLVRFLNFTHKLELIVVNDVTLKVALNSYGLAIPAQAGLDAHRIYVDEAYHGLFSFDMMQQVQKRYLRPEQARINCPSFILDLEAVCAIYDSRTKELLKLLFVIASEMLITDTLRSVHKRPELDEGVKSMVSDHARDEARHHAFFKSLFLLVWPQLTWQQRSLAAEFLPRFTKTFINPDRNDIAASIGSVGVPTDLAKQIVDDVYTDVVVDSYARQCGKAVLDLLEDVVSSSERNCFLETAESLALV